MYLKTFLFVCIICLLVSSLPAQTSTGHAPMTGILTPASGNQPIGSVLNFKATYSDLDGWQNIADVYLVFANQLYQVTKSNIRYNVRNQLLYVRNDANTSWGEGAKPGSRVILENTHLRLYVQSCKILGSGTTLTLDLSLEFKPASVASKAYAWGLVQDLQGLRLDWKLIGDFSFILPASRPLNVTIVPQKLQMVVGEKYTFSSEYWDRQGDFKYLYMLINTSVTGANGVFVMYNALSKKLYLRDVANTTWYGGYAPGSANVIQTAYGKLHCSETTVTISGSRAVVNWRLEMNADISGKSLTGWMYVEDLAVNKDGWDTMGFFQSDSRPVNVSVTPSAGRLLPAVPFRITSRHYDSKGASNLRNLHLMINNTLNGKNAAWVMYDHSLQKLCVRNNDNTEWIIGSAPGTDDIIENDQCRLYCKDTTVTVSGNRIDVGWMIELKRAKAGDAPKSFLYSMNKQNQTDAQGWDQPGSYNQMRPIDETISYLARVMDQYHAGDLWVYRDAGHPANNFSARGAFFDGSVPPIDEHCADFPERGTVIKTGFTGSYENLWGGWYLMNGTLSGDQVEPVANWGTVPNAGVNLKAKRISFMARGAVGGEKVEFFYGGVGRDADWGTAVEPYPDSSPKISTGSITLTTQFKRYTIDLTGVDTSYTLGAFGWAVSALVQTNPEITFYIDDIRFEGSYRLDEPRFLQSYELQPNSGLDFDKQSVQTAYLYDNCMAMIVFTANNYRDRAYVLSRAIIAAVNNDRYYTDGRVRNAYAAGTLTLPPGWTPNGKAGTVKLPRYRANGEYVEDKYCVSTSTGVCAWAAIALDIHADKFSIDLSAQTAQQITAFIENQCKNPNGPGYYTGFSGWEPSPVKETSQSTEHNIDLFTLGMITNRLAPMANHAKAFVTSMWKSDAAGGRFLFGRSPTGTVDNYVVALDCQAWALAALLDPQYLPALTYAENFMRSGNLFSFGTADTSGAWLEGSAQMAVTYLKMNQNAKYQSLLAALELQKLPGGAMKASTAAINTGLYVDGTPWIIYPRPHVGATAWMGLAECGFNPLGTY